MLISSLLLKLVHSFSLYCFLYFDVNCHSFSYFRQRLRSIPDQRVIEKACSKTFYECVPFSFPFVPLYSSLSPLFSRFSFVASLPRSFSYCVHCLPLFHDLDRLYPSENTPFLLGVSWYCFIQISYLGSFILASILFRQHSS